MSFSSSAREAVAALDPLLQPFENINDDHVHLEKQPSVFYLPPSTIQGGVELRTSSRRHPGPVVRILSYIERFSGILYALVAAMLFTCSNFIMQQLNVELFDVFLVRFFFQGIISVTYILFKGYNPFAVTHHVPLVIVRSIIAATGSVSFYCGLVLLPLPDLITIRYTQVVWTALLALIIFRERVTWPIVIASCLTLLGVVCVAQPSFLFAQPTVSNITSPVSTITMSSRRHLLGILVALVCAVSIASNIVLIKKLIDLQFRQSAMMLHFILVTFLSLLIIQTYRYGFSPNRREFNIRSKFLTKNFIFATTLATLQLIPMVLTQKAIKREHPSIVTVVQASDILFALVLKNVFLANKSNALALAGSTLVLASICILGGQKLWLDRRNRRRVPVSSGENK